MRVDRREHVKMLALTGVMLMAGTPVARAAMPRRNAPPLNPFLAASSYALPHAESAQTDSTIFPGPEGPTRDLQPDELRYRDLGVFHAGYLITGPYADGKRAVWTKGSQFMAKFDYDTFDMIAAVRLPGDAHTDTLDHERFLAELDAPGTFAEKFKIAERSGFPRVSGIYTLMDRDNQYFVSGGDGISIYGDSTPGDRLSAVALRKTWRKPAEVTGNFVGMNMTFDGRVILATTDGYIVALSRDLSEYTALRLPQAAAEVPNQRAGVAWIRNGFAVDPAGGIYVASNNHMHKVVWTGTALSIDAKDGAWSEPYPNSLGNGTGATPSLMGFGDDPDKLVVITDGDKLMNMAVFWRDAIPADARKVLGGSTRRLAGLLPCNFGDPNLKAAQSEQSVVIAGYGMAVVNNEPRNVPVEIIANRRTKILVMGYLNHLKEVQPFGVQKIEWDPRRKALRYAWVNGSVSSPNCVPFVSIGSNLLFLVGARDERFTLEAIDWTSGGEAFHLRLGGSRFNSFFSQPIIDQDRRVLYGSIYGAVRLQPKRA